MIANTAFLAGVTVKVVAFSRKERRLDRNDAGEAVARTADQGEDAPVVLLAIQRFAWLECAWHQRFATHVLSADTSTSS